MGFWACPLVTWHSYLVSGCRQESVQNNRKHLIRSKCNSISHHAPCAERNLWWEKGNIGAVSRIYLFTDCCLYIIIPMIKVFTCSCNIDLIFTLELYFVIIKVLMCLSWPNFSFLLPQYILHNLRRKDIKKKYQFRDVKNKGF